METIIHHYLFVGVITLYLFQSFILFVRSKNNQARRTMAWLELLWGLEYLTVFILMLTVVTDKEYALFREKVLIVGNFYIMLTHLFPIQVLLPGWLNWKRIYLLFSPIVILTVVYYGGMRLLGESAESFFTYAALWDSIGHFNVWFRFVLLLSNITYIVVILKWLYKQEKRYIQWKNENFSDQEYVDISWMRSYDYIILGIFTFYMGMLIFGGRISVMFHCVFAAIGFSYLFYKALFYESPYPENFFAPNTLSTENNLKEADRSAESKTISELSFDNKIPVYTAKLKSWMEEEKPYLFNDFKLTDVARILPLNRSYLSRIFNEGFGQNFSEVVRTYRVDYSKEILINNPYMPMHKVAEICGFRSDSTYVKAFKQITGLTPTQFRAKENNE